MRTDQMHIRFYGPYSWVRQEHVPSVFEAELGKEPGVYLWTIPYGMKELVYYVGKTQRNFSVRMLEHFKEHASGGYHLYKPEDFVRGQKTLVWPGRYDMKMKTTVEAFLKRYDSLWSYIRDLARLYRFWLAPLHTDKRILERIEAAIANCLHEQKGRIGEFQEKGVRYRPRRRDEQPIEVSIEADGRILGLPPSLLV